MSLSGKTIRSESSSGTEKGITERAYMLNDPVTERLYDFLDAHGEKLLADTQAKSLRNRLIVIPRNHLDENPARILQNLDSLLTEIKSLCEEHNFTRFLILFRKIPHEVASVFIRESHDPGLDLSSLFGAAYPEAVLFGTNCILKYCRHAPTLQSNRERYTFAPTDDELKAAVQVFLLCVLHRCELFYMNSIIRRDLADSDSLSLLLNVYNRRLRKRWRPVPRHTITDTIVFPVSAYGLERETRVWRGRDRAGKQHALGMRNYLPVPCDAGLEFERFSYLDTPDFPQFTGFSFATFRAVWLGLNQLLINMLPVIWPDSWVTAADYDDLIRRLEYADDYCETALGSGRPESIWKTCHELLARDKPAACPTEEDCRAVIDFLTYRQFDGDVRFVEQPFVFYPLSEQLVFWDYYRHAGLLRCLARNLTRLPSTSATQNKKGETFERAIKAAVSSVQGVMGVRKWIYREGGRAVWDVDVGFVFRNVLFLVDAKNEQKNVRYYFEAVEVSDKVSRRETFLAKLDNNLQTYASSVHAQWQDCKPLRGAICLVCTEEAEFIASVEPKLWLKPYDCPRICLLTELTEFINQPEAVEGIESNPAFIHFST